MVQKTARKKKRISKHVLKSVQQKSKNAADLSKGVEVITRNLDLGENVASSKKSKTLTRKTKDPNEAASYLSNWKHRESGAIWKFNKNTQSWLIRHMYEAEKVSKSTFELLLDYLNGLNISLKNRILQVAEKRALRYKRFEKSLEEKREEVNVDSKVDNVQPEPTVSLPSESSDLDNMRWMQLDDHAKRKEYKRARKILEVLK
jgi:hypothetical protein